MLLEMETTENLSALCVYMSKMFRDKTLDYSGRRYLFKEWTKNRVDSF